jgi:ribonucleoside-diphosphate reductase alpha chain
LARLNIPPSVWQSPGFNLLQHLGFTRKQVAEANDVVCGRGTVENAPHLQVQHYPVFDCANRCGKYGRRFIDVEGHIRMMAATQPFISGAISKTINLPNEATLEQFKSSYYLSWKLGLKANALYRDGSKLSQPLNVTSDVSSDQELEEVEQDDQENVEAARTEVAKEVVEAAKALFARPTGDNIEPAPIQTHIVEKIIERIVERPLRRRLPDTRNATTHKFDVAGHEGYITVGLYEDGSPGEIFIRMAKEGSTIGGLMDTIATLVSVSLQYGVPVESLVRKFEHVRFEPSGMTHNPEIPFAKSLVDYIFRWLAMEFVHGYRAANAPKHDPAAGPPTLPDPVPAKKGGNGHGPRLEPDSARSFSYSEQEMKSSSEKPLSYRLTPRPATSAAASPYVAALVTSASTVGTQWDAVDTAGNESSSRTRNRAVRFRVCLFH